MRFFKLREIVVKVHSKADDRKRARANSSEVLLNGQHRCDDGRRARQKGFSSEELCGWRGRWCLSLSRWTPAGHYQGNTSPKRRKLHDKSHENKDELARV